MSSPEIVKEVDVFTALTLQALNHVHVQHISTGEEGNMLRIVSPHVLNRLGGPFIKHHLQRRWGPHLFSPLSLSLAPSSSAAHLRRSLFGVLTQTLDILNVSFLGFGFGAEAVTLVGDALWVWPGSPLSKLGSLLSELLEGRRDEKGKDGEVEGVWKSRTGELAIPPPLLALGRGHISTPAQMLLHCLEPQPNGEQVLISYCLPLSMDPCDKCSSRLQTAVLKKSVSDTRGAGSPCSQRSKTSRSLVLSSAGLHFSPFNPLSCILTWKHLV